MNIQNIIILVLLLSMANACSHSGQVATGAMVGGIVGGAAGAVIGASLAADRPIDFKEVKVEEVLRIEFKDREFIESQVIDPVQVKQLVSQIKRSSIVEPVQGNYYRTVELVLTNDRIVRIGVFNSYLKNGNNYYKMEKGLNEEVKKRF